MRLEKNKKINYPLFSEYSLSLYLIFLCLVFILGFSMGYFWGQRTGLHFLYEEIKKESLMQEIYARVLYLHRSTNNNENNT